MEIIGVSEYDPSKVIIDEYGKVKVQSSLIQEYKQESFAKAINFPVNCISEIKIEDEYVPEQEEDPGQDPTTKSEPEGNDPNPVDDPTPTSLILE